jgi:gliding motility-associated-like protein
VNPIPVVTANLDESICIGTPFVLSALGAASYSWDNGVVNGVSFVPNSTQVYTVTGTTNGCSSTASVTITVLPLPVADASANVNGGYQPLSVIFQNFSLNATAFTWELGNGTIIPAVSTSNITTTYGDVGVYYVLLTATNGICNDTWTDSIVVIPYPAIEIIVPNVFSPNNDGANDFYFMDVINGKTFEATIFNRWGNKMYTIDTLNAGWDGTIDGTPASDGVYFVKYSVIGMDDSLKEGQAFFHLVR